MQLSSIIPISLPELLNITAMVHTAVLGETQIRALIQENKNLRRWKIEREIVDHYGDVRKKFVEFVLSTVFMFGSVTYAWKVRLEDGMAPDASFWGLLLTAMFLHLVNSHLSFKYVKRVGKKVDSKVEEMKKEIDSGEMLWLGVGVESIRFWLIYVLCVTVAGAVYAIHIFSCFYKDYSQVPRKVVSSI
ncbi:hypothetical protein ACHQM5_006511 [Ranunculus cassubicifolius]